MKNLHHQVVGAGPETVVFLHGLFGQGKNLGTIAANLSDQATCLLMDLPNHGRSPWTVSFDLDLFADLVAGQLQLLKMPRPVLLVGHSLGGKVAMRLTVRYPELVSRLAVIDISPTQTVAAHDFRRFADAMLALPLEQLTSRRQASALLTPQVPSGQVRDFLLQSLRRDEQGHWFWLMNLRLLSQNLDKVAGWPPLTGSWPGPTTWIVGGASDYVRPEHVPIFKAYFPRSELVRVKDATHWVHAEHPAVVTGRLRCLLNRR